MYVCRYVCMYVYMYVCIYIYTYTHLWVSRYFSQLHWTLFAGGFWKHYCIVVSGPRRRPKMSSGRKQTKVISRARSGRVWRHCYHSGFGLVNETHLDWLVMRMLCLFEGSGAPFFGPLLGPLLTKNKGPTKNQNNISTYWLLFVCLSVSQFLLALLVSFVMFFCLLVC